MRRGGENDGSATLTYFRRSKKREEEIERCTSQLPLCWNVVHTGYAAKEEDEGSSLKLISSQVFPCIHLGEGGGGVFKSFFPLGFLRAPLDSPTLEFRCSACSEHRNTSLCHKMFC